MSSLMTKLQSFFLCCPKISPLLIHLNSFIIILFCILSLTWFLHRIYFVILLRSVVQIKEGNPVHMKIFKVYFEQATWRMTVVVYYLTLEYCNLIRNVITVTCINISCFHTCKISASSYSNNFIMDFSIRKWRHLSKIWGFHGSDYEEYGSGLLTFF
jgi:hypothetical protein